MKKFLPVATFFIGVGVAVGIVTHAQVGEKIVSELQSIELDMPIVKEISSISLTQPVGVDVVINDKCEAVVNEIKAFVNLNGKEEYISLYGADTQAISLTADCSNLAGVLKSKIDANGNIIR